jgi:hypothetical protein
MGTPIDVLMRIEPVERSLLMKYLMFSLVALFVVGLCGVATAGDYHTGTTLICNDCHVAHYSQSHGYGTGGAGVFVPLGSAGPYEYLLRNDVNQLCLTCHNGQSWAPDVFGDPTIVNQVRQGGGLNTEAGHGLVNDTGYETSDGHSLYSMDTAPGGTFAASTHGLECTNCHLQHGHVETQYRNLDDWADVTYNRGDPGNNDPTKDVFQHFQLQYTIDDVDFNEPDQQLSAYAAWCGECHTEFHGPGGTTNMGSKAGGNTGFGGDPWVRHPVQDVNIGNTPSAPWISSLAQYYGHTNRVKVMSPSGDWTSGADTEITQSCMSCHKAHGNKNSFSRILMSGTGTITEEGDTDGGTYKALCGQCHIQG